MVPLHVPPPYPPCNQLTVSPFGIPENRGKDNDSQFLLLLGTGVRSQSTGSQSAVS